RSGSPGCPALSRLIFRPFEVLLDRIDCLVGARINSFESLHSGINQYCCDTADHKREDESSQPWRDGGLKRIETGKKQKPNRVQSQYDAGYRNLSCFACFYSLFFDLGLRQANLRADDSLDVTDDVIQNAGKRTITGCGHISLANRSLNRPSGTCGRPESRLWRRQEATGQDARLRERLAREI